MFFIAIVVFVKLWSLRTGIEMRNASRAILGRWNLFHCRASGF
jgi:hypothetical protein